MVNIRRPLKMTSTVDFVISDCSRGHHIRFRGHHSCLCGHCGISRSEIEVRGINSKNEVQKGIAKIKPKFKKGEKGVYIKKDIQSVSLTSGCCGAIRK